MRLKFLLAGTVSVAAAFGCVTANAGTVLYDNISGTSSSGSDSIFARGPIYDSFSTQGSSYSLGGFTVVLGAGNPADGGTFTIAAYTDNATSPDAVIAGTSFTWNDNILTTSLAAHTFTFTPVTLDPNTRYWIGIAADIDSSAVWSYSFDTSGPGVANQFFANVDSVFPNDLGPYQLRVADDIGVGATPLPAALSLFAGGLGALGAIGWRRKRKLAAPVA